MSTFLKSGASVRSVARFVKTVRRADFVLQDWHGNQADEFELMSTITEIQEAIEKLPSSEKSVLAAWLQSKEEPIMSESEETALLARLAGAPVVSLGLRDRREHSSSVLIDVAVRLEGGVDHVVDQNLLLLGPLGMNAACTVMASACH